MSARRVSSRFSLSYLCSSAFICSALLFLQGCENAGEKAALTASQYYFAGSFRQAAALIEPYAAMTDENYALNNARLGSCLLADQNLDGAEAAFLKAYEVMNSVGTNDGGRTLGATLIDEKLKIWKGEPFERAMANFYLGLTYYSRADYNNARAAFENALFKLSDYDDKTDTARAARVESNFEVASIMLGRCWQRLGRDDLAAGAFSKAASSSSSLAALANPDLHKRSNVLLVVDYGNSPRKNSDFATSSLAYRPNLGQAGPIGQPSLLVDNQPYDLQGANEPPLDLVALAQDRRWQSIDTIRSVKSTVGTGLLAAGGVMGAKGLAYDTGARQRTDLMIAGGLLALGALLKGTSQADLRQWTLLPRTTFLLPLALAPGAHTLTLQFPDGSRQTIHNLTAPSPAAGAPGAGEQGADKTFYLRSLRFSRLYE